MNILLQKFKTTIMNNASYGSEREEKKEREKEKETRTG